MHAEGCRNRYISLNSKQAPSGSTCSIVTDGFREKTYEEVKTPVSTISPLLLWSTIKPSGTCKHQLDLLRVDFPSLAATMKFLSFLWLSTIANLVSATPPQWQTLPPWRSRGGRGIIECLAPARLAHPVDPDDCRLIVSQMTTEYDPDQWYTFSTFDPSEHEHPEQAIKIPWTITHGTCSMTMRTGLYNGMSMLMQRIVAGFRDTYRYCLGEPYGLGGTLLFDTLGIGPEAWLMVRRSSSIWLDQPASDSGNTTMSSMTSPPNNATWEGYLEKSSWKSE